ncbi:hypothetical protein [Aquimarina atlantica]|nr:hypothetical protein [Aquimarina atlantica]
MKNRLCTACLLFLSGFLSFAQQEISIAKPSSGNTLSFQAMLNGQKIDVKKLDTKKNISIKPDPALTNSNYILKLNDGSGADITQKQLNSSTGVITGITSGPPLYLIYKSTGYQDLKITDIGINPSSLVSPGTNGNGVTRRTPGTTTNNITSKKYTAIEYLKSGTPKPSFTDDPLYVQNITSGQRYFRDQDRAYVVVDDKGKLIGNVPVNLDQDDVVYIYAIVDRNFVESYDIEVIGAQYAPLDLQIRSYESPAQIGVANAQGLSMADWTIIRFERGPYTSNNVTFNINKTESVDGVAQKLNLSTYSLNINKVYHVAIGASFISTNLGKPDFDVFPLNDSENTINVVNSEDRTMATFNVIFYWKPTIDFIAKKLRGKDHITRGRDVLKEATWLERLNPTFGVSLNNEWRENFFTGLTFEFARGGSLIAGWHYGKVQELVDDDFVLGETIFTGVKEDIKLTDVWDSGFFFGITLDTRIFNKILSRN